MPNALWTACTFALLEHFHTLTFHGKVTMYDYYNVLVHMTDILGVSGLSDHHQLFTRCIREWRYLTMLMQGGRGNDTEWRPTQVNPGKLAIKCPNCPIPGKNLPKDWHKSLIGCTGTRSQVSSSKKDPRLIDGGAYMVARGPFDVWMKATISLCSGLSALEHANTKYAKGHAETGKGIGVCARHKFVQANSVVPLQVGERYANMDYTLASLLLHHSKWLRFILSYNIACQFYKNLLDCIKKLPPLLQFNIIACTMRFVVPKLHIIGHKLACQLLFNIAYLLSGAHTDGEHLWK
ncbi:hypothetical protein GGG16DRAFT_67440 [Schizophyllum commune]